ncbi:stage V sporulation protein E [Paenibacillus vulneris]|uniref:Probable peptidoglycan glycosyltransferase FtsW n=1 Tax=Paenibacillus vulneris TaxID=1133364 RepID=A0ABW3US42_9BACL|nr:MULTISPECIES: putative lipid II flippase FtsW [unclassified Paenibacillus]MBE1447494.1 cell division protein FtsW [Paenibacillus sp. OAS669]
MTSPRRGTPDFLLLFLTFLLVCFGLAMVFSASMAYTRSVQIDGAKITVNDPSYLVIRQAIFVALGTVAMFFCMNIDFNKLKTWVRPMFIVVVIMLLLVPVIGTEINGARSWFRIGSFGIQPAEFAKLAVILYLSNLISKKEDKFNDFQKGLLPALVIVGFISALIMLQPDFGSTMILVMCAAIVIIVGGANIKHLFFLGISGAGVMSVAVAIHMIQSKGDSYKIDRFTSFLNPWADPLVSGYQLIQSFYALGHGGFSGAGFGQGIQKLNYLPEAHTDFIFSIIGEELGFVGATLFIFIYLAFLWRGLTVAVRCKDPFGTLAGVGIVGMIAIQALINLGGVTGSIPLTGVPLPLISYGGSSMLVMLTSVGILLSLSREYNKPDKEPAKKKRA